MLVEHNGSEPSKALSSYSFNGLKVRIVTIEGNPWFVANDACIVLCIASPHVAYRRLAEDEVCYRCRTTVGMNPGRKMALVSESGLYKLIMRSDKPEAKRFQDWVTRDVLPAIRKDVDSTILPLIRYLVIHWNAYGYTGGSTIFGE